MASNNDPVHGASVAYTYDNLNRLATVVDNRLPVGQNTTQYNYDPASNLATVTYPNSLSSNFTYDDLNRITGLFTAKGATTIANYTYVPGPTGVRQSTTELGGRQVNWTYDGIYRLTQETISLDPHSNNGTASYGLDPVGNRLSETSSLPGIPTGNFSYDADDRLATETYDNNGNTLVSGARTFVYDFENRLKSMSNSVTGVNASMIYDGDGNRAAKTANGTTTRYLVDSLNPTRYAQVVEELVDGAVQRTYTYGRQRINQNQLISSTWTPSFYGYDGSGSVRQLTDSTGTVTDTYSYDAWGNSFGSTGSTPNAYLYRGEQYDSDLTLYYLRARYLNPLSGRFLTKAPDAGTIYIPHSLHQYLYVGANPVNRWDPTGHPEGEEEGLTISLDSGVAVLGRQPETVEYIASPFTDVLNTPNWSIELNLQWICDAIAARKIFFLASSITEANLLNANPSSVYGPFTVFGQELSWILSAGYIWANSGSFLLPPPGSIPGCPL
jgi:RHS repeat-associated protein